ncbi:hypothetical protein BDF19DRAFT_450575 [Syncephalis fuscata]|nr:hypothetical protein BDF19DRAFT_450575 [Syncephalis fuscata]
MEEEVGNTTLATDLLSELTDSIHEEFLSDSRRGTQIIDTAPITTIVNTVEPITVVDTVEKVSQKTTPIFPPQKNPDRQIQKSSDQSTIVPTITTPMPSPPMVSPPLQSPPLQITKEQTSSRLFATPQRAPSMDAANVPYRPPSIMVKGNQAGGKSSAAYKRATVYPCSAEADSSITNSVGCGGVAGRPVLNAAMNLLPTDNVALVPMNNGDAQEQEQPIFTGRLYKLGRNRHWQRREFRFDGSYLVCLRPRRERLAANTVRLLKPQSPDDGFYDTKPPLPMVGHPLIATETADGSGWVRYYQAPKWVIPIADMEEISLVTRRGIKVRECFAIVTRERQYVLRGRDRRELACWLFLLKRMVNARRRAELVAATAELEAAQALAASQSMIAPITTPSLDNNRISRATATTMQSNNSRLALGINPKTVAAVASADVVSNQWRRSVGELLGFDPNARSSLRGTHNLS